MIRNLVVCTLGALGFAAAACSSPPPASDFPEDKPGPTPTLPPGTSTFDPKTTDEPAKPADVLQGCATATAAAVQKPLFLVVVYDQSGSMKSDNKWTNAKAAMKTFFNGASAKGINASLTLFPAANNKTCQATEYSTPKVPITALPTDAIGIALDATKPDEDDRGTPTLPALGGGYTYAKTIMGTSAKDGTVALVLVTDGAPNKCDGNSVDANVNLAKVNAATIPTYVVGVGDKLTDLDKVAIGGGTKSAIIVGADPNKTTTELVAAFDKIRSAALACDYAIPAAPEGQTFDRNKVNVQYTPGGAAATALAYSQECKDGTGWKYDNADNPTRILACDNTCNTIKAATGKVDIVFGCATVTSPN